MYLFHNLYTFLIQNYCESLDLNGMLMQSNTSAASIAIKNGTQKFSGTLHHSR